MNASKQQEIMQYMNDLGALVTALQAAPEESQQQALLGEITVMLNDRPNDLPSELTAMLDGVKVMIDS